MSKKFNLDESSIRALADILNDTGLAEIEYEDGDLKVRLSKATSTVTATVAAPAAPAPAPAAPAPEASSSGAPVPAVADHPGVVTSPMVGVVYTSPDPESPAFVNVGDSVSEGQVVMLVEAMKVFNQIKAHKSGKVTSVLVESGAPVEFGEPLLIIE